MEGLTVAEVSYLLRELPLDDATRDAVHRARVRLVEQITPDQVDSIRDLCGERLQRVGFDADYAPNPEGRLLEALIDKLLVE